MENRAYRCATVAATALTVGGLISALTPMPKSPPDVQIRDFGLIAANVDAGAIVDTIESHVRPDLSGAGEVDTQNTTLGELLFGPGWGTADGITDPTSSTSDLTMDESALSALLGGGLDPQALQDAGLSLTPLDLGVANGVAPSLGVLGGGDQAAGTAAAGAATAIFAALQSLPALQQAFTGAVGAAELEFNAALVAAQEAAAERIFGDNPEVNDIVNWIFSLNNTVLAQHESALNNLLGISVDTHGSLLGNVDPDLAEADWNALLGLTPDDFTQIVQAIQADNFSLLLGGIDWSGLFSGIF